MNVPQKRSNRCAYFPFKRAKIEVSGRQKPAEMLHISPNRGNDRRWSECASASGVNEVNGGKDKKLSVQSL